MSDPIRWLRLQAARAAATLALCALIPGLAGPPAATAAEMAPGTARIGSGWTAPVWRWRRVPVNASGRGQGVLAVAVEPAPAGRVAIGDLDGVSLGSADGRFRFAARVPGVTDLCFAPDGALWIGSLSGLWQLTTAGRLTDRSPAPGEHARAIRRVFVAPNGLVVAATQAGAWVSLDGVAWRRLADGLPRGPVAALALDARDVLDTDAISAGPDRIAEVGLWLVVGVELWNVRLRFADTGVSLQSAGRVPIRGAPSAEVPVDLVSGIPGAEIVVVYSRSLAARSPGNGFRILRPVLPPGATAKRLAHAAGRVWLATDRGLLSAAALTGPWHRSESPAGSAAIQGLALTAGRDGLLAASPSGLLHGAPVLLARGQERTPVDGLSPPAPAPAAARDPDIRAVHAASLRYLDLGPERMRALRAGLEKRGWLPTLSLRFAAARDRRWNRDYDEAFLSGETRRLYDRDKDKSLDLEASVLMSWDLGELAFDEDAIDISREHRLIVSLRDNVIDEINQLYFERRGLLERLRDPPPGAEFDPGSVSLRAEELAAGLDAWTGGWFSRPPGAEPLEAAHPSTHPSLGLRPEEQP